MSETQDLLVEVGTEELPPTALRRLAEAFRAGLDRQLDENRLAHGTSHAYASPRRLAVVVEGVPAGQEDRAAVRRGPALAAAFDKDGKPSKPAEGFARSCGVAVDALEQLETDQGSWLVWRSVEAGQATTALIPDLVEHALKALPIPKRMRWNDCETEFVRPVHWVVVLFGSATVDASILGIPCDRFSYGHRFHHNEKISLADPSVYVDTLEKTGHVMVDMDQRCESIRRQVIEAGRALGGNAQIDAALLEEVAALVEWPAAIAGSFDRRFLEVPAEALVSSMQAHQKYFPVLDADGRLMPHFITVSNIESKEPQQVRAGNERVLQARLEDAVFFWNQDRRQSLDSFAVELDTVTFEKRLGSLGDKQRRIRVIATHIAEALGFDVARAQRAASLCKCDLLTRMVYEFPELQGVMGRYYAVHSGDDAAVAVALDEQYRPRFAGDALPATSTGQAIAIADRIDTLMGIFAIGQPPTGDKDPFGLRRAALGVLRILIEGGLDLDLRTLLEVAADAFPETLNTGGIADNLYDFIMERLRAYYLDAGYGIDTFEAVLARRPSSPLDFEQRMRAVRAFRELPEAASLAAANKRINNILRKAGMDSSTSYRAELLTEAAEQALGQAVGALAVAVEPLLADRNYADTLRELAALHVPVDNFFDSVMVMADDAALRDNRLALLQALSILFLQVADISRLQN